MARPRLAILLDRFEVSPVRLLELFEHLNDGAALPEVQFIVHSHTDLIVQGEAGRFREFRL